MFVGVSLIYSRKEIGIERLTYSHTYYMVVCMKVKTTLKIDDSVMKRLKKEAVRRGCTMSDLVESGLRLLFQTDKTARKITPLPKFKSGGPLVDIADRDALYQAMEGR
jgi:hypothetical protein